MEVIDPVRSITFYIMNVIQWLRSKWSRELTEFEKTHYEKFEQAVSECDVEAYVYEDNGVKGQVIVLQGEDLHAVTEKNLVSFRKLTRRERRYLDKTYKAKRARPHEKDNNILRQTDG